MTLSDFLNFFDEPVSKGTFGIVISLIIIGMFLWHLKVLLSNHVTETDKKIDKLAKDVKDNRKEIKGEIKENRQEMKDGHARLEDKLEKLLQKK